jgi:hypothetical protein
MTVGFANDQLDNSDAQEQVEIIEPPGVLPLNFPLMIEAALAGTTTTVSSQESNRVLSNTGYQVVDTLNVSSPLTYGVAQQVFNRFSNGQQISAEILAQVINAFVTYARIPRQLILAIPAHWMLADSGATM